MKRSDDVGEGLNDQFTLIETKFATVTSGRVIDTYSETSD